MIIYSFKNNITKYLNLGKIFYQKPIYNCKNCGYKGLQHRHGYYYRTVITLFSSHRIPVLRVKCPMCNKTHSILPSFVIPYFQYSFNFIITSLFMVYIKKYSYSIIVNISLLLNSNSSFSSSNLYFFKKRMKSTYHITNSFFTLFKDFYSNMDAPSLFHVITNITLFLKIPSDFNYTYFANMPSYFFYKS